VATQIKLMQRDLTPVDFEFSLGDFKSVQAYNEKLAHLVLTRQLDGRDHGSLQNGIANAIRALQRPAQGSQQNVNVVVSDPDVIIAGFVNSLPGPLRNVVIVWGQQQRRLRMAGPSQPSVVA
jgi:hypothetical protein